MSGLDETTGVTTVDSSVARARRKPPARHARPRSDPRSPAYRADIEGLRALAVLGVLIYHAGAPFLPGGFVGVDVFFVISGFLITGLIHEEIAKTGRLSLPRFYARRIKRLLPAGAAVLTLTAIASSFLLPPIQRSSVGTDIVWSALYGANWRFAFEQTDYLNHDGPPSPVLHYWSLAVEEQYYFVWPVLLGVLGTVVLRRKLSLRFAMFTAMSLLGIVSFFWSLHLTETNQPFAFFGTPARVWELAVGGCLALAVPHLGSIRGVFRAVIGWAGLVVVVASMFLLEESGSFPGTAVLWPTLGTAAVIFAGMNRPRRRAHDDLRVGPVVVLDWPFMRHTGRISYSLYLWHWPPLVLLAAVLDREEVGFALGLVVLAVVWPVAWLSWALLEEPFRRSKVLGSSPRRALGLAAICMSAALASTLLLFTSGGTEIGVAQEDGQIIQVDVASARLDSPAKWSECQQDFAGTDPKSCSLSDVDSDTTMAVVGDSHATQWVDTFTAMADERGWRMDMYSKAGCGPAAIPQWHFALNRNYKECTTWREKVLDRLIDSSARPDVVVIAARSNTLAASGGAESDPAESFTEVIDGLEETYRRLVDAGLRVVVLEPLPQPDVDVPLCLSQKGGDPDECTFALKSGFPEGGPAERIAAERVDGIEFVEMNDLVCPDGECRPVRRDTLVFRDDNHLSKSYVDTIRADVLQRFEESGAFDGVGKRSEA